MHNHLNYTHAKFETKGNYLHFFELLRFDALKFIIWMISICVVFFLFCKNEEKYSQQLFVKDKHHLTIESHWFS